VLVTLATVAFATLSPLTSPPDSSEPTDAITLDAERQAILDDLVSLGIMQDQPVESYCLAPLLVEFPDDDLDVLAERVLNAVDVEIGVGSVEPLADRLSDAEAQLAYDSLVCIAGDADPGLIEDAVSTVSDDDDFAEWSLDCVRATLTVFPDDLLEDAADANGPDDLRARLSDAIDEARVTTSREDLDELRQHVTSLFFCAPNGRELIAETNLASDTTPATAVD
jgi:hypothetical protein